MVTLPLDPAKRVPPDVRQRISLRNSRGRSRRRVPKRADGSATRTCGGGPRPGDGVLGPPPEVVGLEPPLGEPGLEPVSGQQAPRTPERLLDLRGRAAGEKHFTATDTRTSCKVGNREDGAVGRGEVLLEELVGKDQSDAGGCHVARVGTPRAEPGHPWGAGP